MASQFSVFILRNLYSDAERANFGPFIHIVYRFSAFIEKWLEVNGGEFRIIQHYGDDGYITNFKVAIFKPEEQNTAMLFALQTSQDEIAVRLLVDHIDEAVLAQVAFERGAHR